MKDKTRNLSVGLTVLVGLALLGGMILIFRELPGFMRVGYEIKVSFPDTGGITSGADVFLRGKRIGRVADVEFTDGDPRKGITFTLVIDRSEKIPGDVNFYVRSGFLGGTAIHLESDGLPPGDGRTDPLTGQPLKWFPKDRVLTEKGAWKPGGGGGPIPEDLLADVRKGMASLTNLADTLNDFFSPPPPPRTRPSTTAPGQAAPPAGPNFHTTMAKLDQALEAITKVFGDEENQANLKAALANFKTAAGATAEAMDQVKSVAAAAKGTLSDLSTASKSASARFDDLMTRLIDDADRLGRALTSLNQAIVKINHGKGSAAKFINDPVLYNNLVDITAQLKATMVRLQELLEAWKKQGIKLQLK